MANVPRRSERDIVLVRFDKKKDHRELQTTSGRNALTFKSGFSKEKTPDISATRHSETILKVTPNADLQPGEYLLTFGAGGLLGYDFVINVDDRDVKFSSTQNRLRSSDGSRITNLRCPALSKGRGFSGRVGNAVQSG